MEIMRLTPVLFEQMWGGQQLYSIWHKHCHADCNYGESWELSFLPCGMSTVNDVPIDVATKGHLGTLVEQCDTFPMLNKIITACQDLSVQVHPNNEYALRVEGQLGKTEMWYIIDAQEGAGLYLGTKSVMSVEQVRSAIQGNTLLEHLRFYPVKRGDCYMIPSGTIHAIGKGITLYEVQQNSNITYRLYDYGRLDTNGQTRTLHIDKALDVSVLQPYSCHNHGLMMGKGITLLGKTEYFAVYHYDIEDSIVINADSASFQCLTCIEGSGTIHSMPFVKGDSFFIPANFGKYHIVGKCHMILSTVE